MTPEIEKAFEALKAAIGKALQGEYDRGKREAARDAMANIAAALGVAEEPKRRRRRRAKTEA